MSDSPEAKLNTVGLLDSLRKSLNWRPKKPTETPTAVPPPAGVSSLPEAVGLVPADAPGLARRPESPPPEVTSASLPQAPLPEVLVPTAEAPSSSGADNNLPDWLRSLREEQEEEVVPAPIPTPETPPVLPVAEAPAPPPEAQVAGDPFATNKEFNGYMETIRQAQTVLASGTALSSEERRQALISIAKANSLLPKLPSEVLKSVLLMRAVASRNPKFGRNDFQLEMLAAMDVIKGKK